MNILLVSPQNENAFLRYLDPCIKNCWKLSLLISPNNPILQSPKYNADLLDEVILIPKLSNRIEDISPYLYIKKWDAVVPGGEYAVTISESISKYLGVFYNSVTRSNSYRNKKEMRAIFEKYDVPQPKVHHIFSSVEELAYCNWESIDFPVIVKPIDCAGSLWVRLCNTPDEIKINIARICKSTISSTTGLRFAGKALVEEAIIGDEFSAECVIEEKTILKIFLIKKYVSPYPYCDEIGHLCLNEIPFAIKEILVTAIHSIVLAWGIHSSILHVEFKISHTNQKIYIIEVANRIAGDHISELIELKHGWNLEKVLIYLRSKKKVAEQFSKASSHQKFYAIKFIYFLDTFNIGQDIEVIKKSIPKGTFKKNIDRGDYNIVNRKGFFITSGAYDKLDQLLSSKM